GSEISMFSYDLVSGHRIILGSTSTFQGCDHHYDAVKIPLAEATRFLLSRCTGLLLSKALLTNPTLTDEQSDFVGRNLAKAQLSLGDALLASFGLYHWSVLKRN